MRDVAGQEVKEGNFILVKLGSEWIPAIVHKLEAGGVIVASNPTQKGQAITPEKMYVLFEINMADAIPGQPHPTIRRIPFPGKERITSVDN